MYCLLAAFYRQDEDALLSTKTPEDKTVTMWYKCKKKLWFIHELTARDTSKTAKITKR